MEKKVATEKLLEEFARFFAINFIYLCFGDMIVGSLDKEAIINKGIVFSVSLIASLISFLVFNICRMWKKSIKIEVEMIDQASKKNDETMLYYNMISAHRVNKIEAKIELIVTNSFWNRVIYLILKKQKIELAFVPQPTNASIECNSFSYPDYINKCYNGFKMDISETVKNNIQDNMHHKLYIHLDAKVNRDAPRLQENREYPIRPYLLINDKKLNFFYKLFIGTYLKCNSRDFYIINYVYNN